MGSSNFSSVHRRRQLKYKCLGVTVLLQKEKKVIIFSCHKGTLISFVFFFDVTCVTWPMSRKIFWGDVVTTSPLISWDGGKKWNSYFWTLEKFLLLLWTTAMFLNVVFLGGRAYFWIVFFKFYGFIRLNQPTVCFPRWSHFNADFVHYYFYWTDMFVGLRGLSVGRQSK
jgi:hypothetical protein